MVTFGGDATSPYDRIRVRKGEVIIGRPLRWDVYDDSGQLLLSKGYIVANERQRQRLLEEGWHVRGELSSVIPDPEGSAVDDEPSIGGNPFVTLDQLTLRLEGILGMIQRGAADVGPQQRIRKLGKIIQVLCKHEADASLGAAHLHHETPYPYRHSVHTALLCELVARRLGWQPERRLSLVAAALSSNVAMTELQAKLVDQAEPLNDTQWDAIQAHPQRGYEMLRAAGVTDPLWLHAVLQHHECLNGRGYPAGVRGDDVIPEARLLGLADRYHAMVTGRSYRNGMLVKDALRRIFLDVGQELGSRLAQVFIKELGIYPPGSVVRLGNGEIAVVTRRKGVLGGPMLAAIANRKGEHYAQPLYRDCSDSEEYAIKEICPSSSPLPFGVSRLWGY